MKSEIQHCNKIIYCNYRPQGYVFTGVCLSMGGSLSWAFLSRRDLCPGIDSLSRGSLSRGVSVHGLGSLSMVGVSVQGDLYPGGSLSREISIKGDLCPERSLSKGSLSGRPSRQRPSYSKNLSLSVLKICKLSRLCTN